MNMQEVKVFLNGQIFTSNPRQPYADAMVVRDGAIEWIGTEHDLNAPEAARIDLKGRRVLPGLIDARMDPVFLASVDAQSADPLPQKKMEETARELAVLGSKLLAHGITSVADVFARKLPTDYFHLYQAAQKAGFKQRAVIYYVWEDLKKKPALNPLFMDKTASIFIGGVKTLAAGSVSEKTTRAHPSYPGDDQDFGIPATTKEALREASVYAKRNGLNLMIQTMDELAIDLVAEAFHGDLIAPQIRIEHTGGPVTGRAATSNPFAGIQAAVTSNSKSNSCNRQVRPIDPAAAVNLYTRDAQQITGIPNVGQLAPGYHADFIVLDRDILNVEHETIGQTQVEETYMGGKLVYRKR
jgi:hypothetical protein